MNPETLNKLRQAIQAGNDVETSAHFAGISIANVYRWLELGKNEAERIAVGTPADPEQAEYLSFWEELRQARATAIVRNVSYVQTAAQNGNWQAAKWWLEQTVPEVYSKGTKPTKDVTAESPKSVGA
jgi:hypothetical protein